MKIEIELTDEEAYAILRTAGRACAYWAETDHNLCSLARTGPARITRTESVAIRDRETGEALGSLTLAAFKRAPTLLAEQSGGRGVGGTDLLAQLFEGCSPGSVDEPCADVLVQLAMFGEVRFG